MTSALIIPTNAITPDRLRSRVIKWTDKYRHGLIANPDPQGPVIYATYLEVPWKLGEPDIGRGLRVGETVEFYLVPGYRTGTLKAEQITRIPHA